LEIVVCGRNVEVPEHFRDHTAEKLGRLERYDHKIVRMEVQLSHEPNPRRSKNCQRIEITGRGRGPVVRGEGCAADFYCAMDQAVARLEARMRRAHDRRRVSHGRRVPVSVAQATGLLSSPETTTASAAGIVTELLDRESWEIEVPAARMPADDVVGDPGEEIDEYAPGQVVRTKEHHAIPMTVDDALSQMELVGHDFFLFSDKDSGRPSVVYRRHGYAYGVIALV
jgi:ribosomal subunit interface protein